MGSDHDKLLYVEVRWLSRGRLLHRLVELKEEELFLIEENPTSATCSTMKTGCATFLT
jgi:hypothetical protein